MAIQGVLRQEVGRRAEAANRQGEEKGTELKVHPAG